MRRAITSTPKITSYRFGDEQVGGIDREVPHFDAPHFDAPHFDLGAARDDAFALREQIYDVVGSASLSVCLHREELLGEAAAKCVAVR